MNKTLSVILLIAGVILIITGISAANSVSSGVSKVFTGAPTNKALWMLIGGVVAAVIGLAGTLRGGGSRLD